MARKDAIAKLRVTLLKRRDALIRSALGDLSLLQGKPSKTGDVLDAVADTVQSELNSQLLEVESQEDLVPVADDVREVRAWLDHLLEQALADGKVQPQEWKLLEHVAKGAGVKKRELELMLREARRRLFDEARDARRESRKRVPTPARRILRM